MASTASAKHLRREAMEQVHVYNSKLLLDRKLRMPYIDNQTGLAQQDCHLWVSRVQRCTPVKEGQIYSYPSRRWRVRKRPDFVGTVKQIEKAKQEIDETQIETVQDEKVTVNEDSNMSFDTSSQSTAAVYDDVYFEDETYDSEYDSGEEFGPRKTKKRRGAKNKVTGNMKKKNMVEYFKESQKARFSTTKKNSMALKLADKIRAVSREELNMMTEEERKKPYDCQLCGKRYKNQQGLRYHYEHHNHDLDETPQPLPVPTPTPQQINVPEMQPADDIPPADHVAGAKRKKGTPASSYCDFCLGNTEVNKKSGISEELISCADCGRSGHPSCLQFNENLTSQVKIYKWQCIECKCCCLCGTSDNDEQLLFCDDCDRGYHMYCLNPPIAEPPEGSWQCQLCEARVKGQDITKVAVLPEHMDVKR